MASSLDKKSGNWRLPLPGHKYGPRSTCSSKDQGKGGARILGNKGSNDSEGHHGGLAAAMVSHLLAEDI